MNEGIIDEKDISFTNSINIEETKLFTIKFKLNAPVSANRVIFKFSEANFPALKILSGYTLTQENDRNYTVTETTI